MGDGLADIYQVTGLNCMVLAIHKVRIAEARYSWLSYFEFNLNGVKGKVDLLNTYNKTNYSEVYSMSKMRV